MMTRMIWEGKNPYRLLVEMLSVAPMKMGMKPLQITKNRTTI
jgi:hypothetical protein